MSDIMNTKEFAIELISKASFIDRIDDVDKYALYSVTVYVIRLSPEAHNEYIFSTCFNDRDCYDTFEEYEEYLAQKDREKKEFNRRIVELLGITADGVTVTQAVSEIFTVTQITKIEEVSK